MRTTIEKYCTKVSGYTASEFEKDAKDYIDAIKNRSMFCIIVSVAKSGMSRVLKFNSYTRGNYRSYYCLFKALGYTEVKDGFRINGCGMDMVFNTNYEIIHDFHKLGIIDKETCDNLAQQTPIRF